MRTKLKGSILVFTLIVMSMILVTALTLSTTMITERKASTITRSSSAAIQGADSGLEFVLREFRHEYDSGQEYKDFIDDLILAGSSRGYHSYCDDGSGSETHNTDDTGDYIIEIPDPEQVLRIQAIIKDQHGVDHPSVSCKDSSAAASPTDPPVSNVLLQRIVAIKAIGEDRIAARALRIDMGQSINRGMFAFWDFEDYENAFITTHEEDQVVLASDMSKGGNAAYLCPDDEQSSSVCPGSGDDMNPGPRHSRSGFNDGISWYGDRDFDSTPTVEGVADHDLDTNNHWAMSFNVDENNDAAPSTPNEYLLVENDALTPLDDGSFSLSVWVRPKIDNADQIVIGKGITPTNNKKFRLTLESQTPHFFIRSGSKSVNLAFGSISKDDWYHIVVTYEKRQPGNEIITGYINGHEEGSDNSTNIASIETNHSLIMGMDEAGARNFIGQMDDVRLYNRVLNLDEVIQLCRKGENSGFPGNCPAAP